jgi:predicted nucleic acid-binding protein
MARLAAAVSFGQDALPDGALVLVDSAPIIYTLEANVRYADRFAMLFERHAEGALTLAVSTVTIAEVITGPLAKNEEGLAKRYRAVLDAWQVVDFTSDIAESAARLRARFGLNLPDAIQAASALAINADALVTHDRDFSAVRGLRVMI